MFLRTQKDDQYRVIPGKTKDVVANVEAGVYTLEIQKSLFGTSIFLQKTNRYKNGNILNSGTFKEAKEHLEDFVSPEMYEIREAMGSMHKIGLIFNGKPGTGKTYLAGQLAEKLVKEKNALCIFSIGEPKIALSGFIDSIREEDPDRLIVLIIDEYEKRNSGEIDIMSFLDGGESRNNVIVIATVNSTTRLPDTIINRVGRIEKIYNFDQVDLAIITKTVESVIPEKYKEHVNAKEFAKTILEGTEEDRRIDNIALQIRNLIFAKITGKEIRKVNSYKNEEPKKNKLQLPKFVKRRSRGKICLN
ncbi:MAG TPA: AAA family ATPase [Methanosarcinales archaeon]|nr:AAA family ATPase [Methanosarcinales archaeon]